MNWYRMRMGLRMLVCGMAGTGLSLESIARAPAARMLVRDSEQLAHAASSFGRARARTWGAVIGAINEVAGRVHPSFGRGGELVTLRDPDAILGAMWLRRRIGTAPVIDAGASAAALRDQRPLLATHTVSVPSVDAAVVLRATLRSPGNDFAVAGRASTPVSVYVNGQHHSDVFVLAERTEPHRINLSGLTPGEHVIELREARDIAGGGGMAVQVDSLASQTLDGVAALVTRHAPVIETRWTPELASTGIANATYNDMPLVSVGLVEEAPHGLRRIRYHVLSSNEDTSGFTLQSIMRKFGRSTDFEMAYECWVDDAGRLVAEGYQSPFHIRRPFGGERVNGRPVLRVTTGNGLYAGNSYGLTPRWSEAPSRVFDRIPTDREVMLDNPWTFAVMGKELVREGRAASRGSMPDSMRIAFDAREHLYFDATGPARAALEGERQLTVVLDDATRHTFAISKQDWRPAPRGIPPRTTAIALPPSIPSGRIAALDLPPGRVFTLDDEFHPRFIPAVRHAGVDPAGWGDRV